MEKGVDGGPLGLKLGNAKWGLGFFAVEIQCLWFGGGFGLCVAVVYFLIVFMVSYLLKHFNNQLFRYFETAVTVYAFISFDIKHVVF